MDPALRWGDVGKTIALCRTLEEHGEAIEADLQRFHGLRLAQIGSKALTWRHLRILIEHLPRDSAFVRSIVGADGEWTLTDQLLATAIDVLQLANWQRSGNAKAPRPTPLPRPGVDDGRITGPSKAKRTPEEVRAIFAEMAEAEARGELAGTEQDVKTV